MQQPTGAGRDGLTVRVDTTGPRRGESVYCMYLCAFDTEASNSEIIQLRSYSVLARARVCSCVCRVLLGGVTEKW